MNSLSNAVQADDHPVIRLNGVGVRFGSNRVLEDVSLDLYRGSITALLGTNGAGKSTLIGAMSGANPHYTGDIVREGMATRISSPAQARRVGIETVHQRIADGIVPGLSVADNLVLTDLASGGHRVVRRAETERAARAALSRLGLDWSDEVLRADVERLGTSDAQLLILARALRQSPSVLILDEPTSALTAAEADRLFDVLRALRDGTPATDATPARPPLSILFVSHRFGEIERLADRIVVLRDGALALSAERPFDWEAALTAMLGVPTDVQQHVTEPLPAGEPVLHIDGVHLVTGAGAMALTVHAGQVTGILGLLGAGKSELAETIAGVRNAGEASMTLRGSSYAPAAPAAALQHGVVLVPEDRQRDGIQPGWSIANTVGLPVLSQIANKIGVVRTSRERGLGREVIDDFGVVAESPDTPVDELSGGNQQKVIVGRWLRTQPRLALLDEPFRGVDIGARRTIGEAARQQAAGGAGVVVLSSDVDEILEVADRIIVLVAGTIALDAAATTVDRATVVSALLADGADAQSSADAERIGDEHPVADIRKNEETQ